MIGQFLIFIFYFFRTKALPDLHRLTVTEEQTMVGDTIPILPPWVTTTTRSNSSSKWPCKDTMVVVVTRGDIRMEEERLRR